MIVQVDDAGPQPRIAEIDELAAARDDFASPDGDDLAAAHDQGAPVDGRTNGGEDAGGQEAGDPFLLCRQCSGQCQSQCQPGIEVPHHCGRAALRR